MSAPATKPSLPDAAAVKKAQDLAAQVFGQETANAKSPKDKALLAAKILNTAIATKNDAPSRYALFEMARSLSSNAGSTSTAFAAISGLEEYPIDSLTLALETLAGLAKSVGGQDAAATIDQTDLLIADAIAQGRYETAQQLANLSVQLAKTTGDERLIRQCGLLPGDTREIVAMCSGATKAMAALAVNPKDAAANLVAGRFYCVARDDWQKGSAMLALSDDATLGPLAWKELTKSNWPRDQLDLADGWLEAASKEKALTSRQFRRHAIQWYRAAILALEGLSKAKVQRLLEAMDAETECDLLKLVDLGEDTAAGRWTFRNGALVAEGDRGKLQLPCRPSGDYVLTAELTLSNVKGMAGLVLCQGDNQLLLKLYCDHCELASAIDKANKGNPRGNATIGRDLPRPLAAGQRQTCQVSVRKTAIELFLNRRLVCQYGMEEGNALSADGRRISDNDGLGLEVQDGMVSFHSLSVRWTALLAQAEHVAFGNE